MLQAPRVERLFAHRFRTDDLGFLDIDHSPELFRAEHLLQDQAALIVGAPWLGKSTTARQLERWLRCQPADFRFGSRLCLTALGVQGAERDLPPVWWEAWRQSATAFAACWIIDALDEGEERIGGVRERIIQEIGQLDEAHRDRLRLLIFSRDREWLDEFWGDLAQAYRLHRLLQLPEFRLAPLDRGAAQRMLSSTSEAFNRIADLIRRYQLQPVAGYPVVLDYLHRQRITSDLSVVRVWHGIIQHLLDDPDSSRRRALHSEPDDRFQAAARIAALLTLTDGEQVVDHSRQVCLITLADMFPPAIAGANRRAAREACELSLFLTTPEGGYRFAQRNVRDWLAAFGLADVRLGPLRAVLTDEQGQPFPRHRDLLALLRQVSRHDDVRSWIETISGGLPLASDLIGPSLAQSLQCIDRLEELANSAPSTLRAYDASFGRLDTPGLGNELALRIRDSQRQPAAKELLLELALATEPEPVLTAAVEIVADSSQPLLLRHHALDLIEYHGGDAHFRALAQPVGRSEGQALAETLLRARVILRLLERGLWTITEAVPLVSPSEPHNHDARQRVLTWIEEHMTGNDARTLLQQRHQHRTALQLVAHHFRYQDLFHVAVERLMQEDQLDETDERLLVDVVLERQDDERRADLKYPVMQRLGASSVGRRYLFERWVEAHRGNPQQGRTWTLILRPEDWHWLMSRAQSDWSDVRHVWEDLYWLSVAARNAGQMSTDQWEQVSRLVAERAPGIPAYFEQNRQAAERVERREQERREAYQRRYPPRTLAQVTANILGLSNLSAAARMQELAWLCFVPDVRPENLTGSWQDLEPGLQSRVRAALRQGLEEASPTPLPDVNEFPGTILAEAWAFRVALDDPEQSGWLNLDRLNRWLPTAIFALHDRIPALASRCGQIDQEATLRILLDGAERELRAGHQYATRARAIPVEFWNNGQVAERVAGWTQDPRFHPESRSNLLELLSLRAPDIAGPIALAWSQTPNDGNEIAAVLRRAAINCLLALDAGAAWPLIDADYRQRGRQSLLELTTLHADHAELRVDLQQWPTTRLEAVCRLLLEAFPVRIDLERTTRVTRVTAATQLCEVRDRAISLLLHQESQEAREILDRLAASDAGLAEWLCGHRVRREAQAVVSNLPPAEQESAPQLSVTDAIRVLDQADYRLIRSSDDLLEVVRDVLRLVEQDVAADLAMLYGKPARQKDSNGDAIPRDHLEEDALQAYVRRRLSDLLPRLVREVEVLSLREDQVRFRRRLDLRVVAPCLNRRVATVVIEVKWSDNRETDTSLVEQLGRRYLLGEGLTHGVFLVGWCGHWHQTGTGRQSRRADLESFLIDQRNRFCGDGDGAGLQIESIVLGLEWEEQQTTPSS